MQFFKTGMLLAGLVMGSMAVEAQSVSKIRRAYKATPPKAVLVQLATHQRKIDHYKKVNQPANIAQVQKDAGKVNSLIVQDFTDNFNFCPVYYYYDTNADLVKSQKFDGILLDKGLQPVNTSALNSIDTNYVITYFGKLMQDNSLDPEHYKINPRKTYRSNDNVLTDTYTMVVLNHQFKQMPKFTPRSSKKAFSSGFFGSSKYKYKSSKFNIYYMASAKILNEKFHDFYL